MRCFFQSAILFFVFVVPVYAAEQSSEGKDSSEIYLANATTAEVAGSLQNAKYSPGPGSAEISLPLEWRNILIDLRDKPAVARNSADYYK